MDTGPKSAMTRVSGENCSVVQAHINNPELSQYIKDYYFYCDAGVPLLFTENETNKERIFGEPNESLYVKDGINNYIVHGKTDVVNPDQVGTKMAPHYQLMVGAGETAVIKLRLTQAPPEEVGYPFGDYFDRSFAARLQEADEFYATVIPPQVLAAPDRANVMRQALAGMMWTNQYFYYDLSIWLRERDINPCTPMGRSLPMSGPLGMLTRPFMPLLPGKSTCAIANVTMASAISTSSKKSVMYPVIPPQACLAVTPTGAVRSGCR
jgi:hypothetical protein